MAAPRHRLARALVPAALALVLGCSTIGLVKDPTPWVAAADWSAAEDLTLSVADTSLEPQVLRLEEGRAYRLILDNRGTQTCPLVVGQLYRAVATRKVEMPGALELRVPYLSGLTLYPTHPLDWSFVAVRPGTYEIQCGQGPRGAVQILQKPPPPPAPAQKKPAPAG